MARGSGRPRRPVEWMSFNTGTILDTTSTSSVYTLAAAATLDEFTAPTIVRVRGGGGFSADFPAAPTGAPVMGRIGVGITVVTSVAAAAAAVPTPFVDAEWSWLYWQCFMIGASTVAGAAAGTTEAKVWQFDSKAMRKIHQPAESTLIMVVDTEFVDTTQITAIRYWIAGRFLAKE